MPKPDILRQVRLLWRTSTIARPGESGGDTWGDLPLMFRAGSDAWMTGSYDPVTRLVYWGTSRDLVFIGDWGRHVFAYDVRNGEPLWQSRLPTMANGFPITYAVDGKQFVAFVAGPSISRSSWATVLPADLIPEEHNPRSGSGVFVFALP